MAITVLMFATPFVNYIMYLLLMFRETRWYEGHLFLSLENTSLFVKTKELLLLHSTSSRKLAFIR